MPDQWFGTLSVEVDIEVDIGSADDADAAPDDPGDDDAPVVVPRAIFPPLRRWAAERLVRRDLMSWSHVYARARALDPRGGAALMAGLLDSADALADPVRRLLVDVAIGWPHNDIRKAGLILLAARDGVLIDSRAVAELLGLAQLNTVSSYQRRYPDMPRPVVDMGQGRCKLWRVRR